MCVCNKTLYSASVKDTAKSQVVVKIINAINIQWTQEACHFGGPEKKISVFCVNKVEPYANQVTEYIR